jgi:hypothetical protein
MALLLLEPIMSSNGLYGSPDIALNTAFVGTMEFNGEMFVGNVHWVSNLSLLMVEKS